MPNKDQAQQMRKMLRLVISCLQYSGIRVPEGMTTKRFDNMDDAEAVAYGLRLWDNTALWSSMPDNFQIGSESRTMVVAKQTLLRSMMAGLAPYQRGRITRG